MSEHLEKALGPITLWGLGVGLVISGMYFGWNLGLAEGGTLGLAIATFFVALMYVGFTFSYTELAASLPKAGGGFLYADRALGENWGFLAGLAQIIEFVFAPPAIAAAIGAYFHLFFPQVSVLSIALLSYALFTALNIYGVKVAARFELIITVLAVIELFIFAGATLPSFHLENLSLNAFPHGVRGIFAAIPFAIWFFLGIEGVANAAEETINPQKNIVLGFGWAILTLVLLCILTFVSSVGVAGWEKIVYPSPGAAPSDSPLPLALSFVVGENSWLYHLLITVGLFGLLASFHGIILAAGRATMEFGRAGHIPSFLAQVHPRFRTPMWALVVNMMVGILALLSGRTGQIITLACFGALTLYIVSLFSLFKLRQNEPQLKRPFKTMLYPWLPLSALLIALVSLAAMIFFNHLLALIYFAMLFSGFIFKGLLQRKLKKAIHE